MQENYFGEKFTDGLKIATLLASAVLPAINTNELMAQNNIREIGQPPMPATEPLSNADFSEYLRDISVEKEIVHQHGRILSNDEISRLSAILRKHGNWELILIDSSILKSMDMPLEELLQNDIKRIFGTPRDFGRDEAPPSLMFAVATDSQLEEFQTFSSSKAGYGKVKLTELKINHQELNDIYRDHGLESVVDKILSKRRADDDKRVLTLLVGSGVVTFLVMGGAFAYVIKASDKHFNESRKQ